MPPPVLDNMMRLAARHHAAGRVREAAAVYQQVLHKDPHHAGALHGLGVMAYQTGRPTAAEKLLVRALAADPGRASAHDDLASLRLASGRAGEALAGYRHAVRLEPAFALAHAHLGTALARLGQFDQAVVAYQRAVELGVLARRRRVAGIAVESPASAAMTVGMTAAAAGDPAAPPPPVDPDGPPPEMFVVVDPSDIGARELVEPYLAGPAVPPVPVPSPDEPSWLAALVGPVEATDAAAGWADAALASALQAHGGRDGGEGGGAWPDARLALVEPDLGDPRLDAPWAAALAPTAGAAGRTADEGIALAATVGSGDVPTGESTRAPASPAGYDSGPVSEGPAGAVAPSPEDGPAADPLGVGTFDPTDGELYAGASNSGAGFAPDAGADATAPGDVAAFGIAAFSSPPAPQAAGPAPSAPDPLMSSQQAPTGLALLDSNTLSPAAAEAAVTGAVAVVAGPEPELGSLNLVPGGVAAAGAASPDPADATATTTSPAESDGVPVGDLGRAVGMARPAAGVRAAARPATPDARVGVGPPRPGAGPSRAGPTRAGVTPPGRGPARGAFGVLGVRPAGGEPADLNGDAGLAAEAFDADAATDADAAVAAGPAADGARVVSLSELDLPTGDQDPLVATRLLAKQLRRVRRTPAAAAQQALELHKEGTNHLRLRRVDEAIAALGRLVELHPTSARAYRDLGAAYLRADRLEEAQAALVRALELRPRFADAFASIGDVFHLQGKVDEAIACYRKALQLKPSAAKVHSNLLLTLNYHRKLDAAAIFAEHARWARQHADALAGQAPEHENDPDPDRPIRVGYVSPDFRRHSVNYFVEPLLAARDRAAFHVTCYSDVIRPDDETDRIMTLCDRWRDVRQLSDEEVAKRVRDDGIDVLVDLAGHTGTNRLGAFARKPAPVQVTYLGYPNTTGMRAVDYRVTDAAADPPGKTEALHTEHLVRLPNFLCYQPPDGAPDPGPSPVGANGFVTFGCFNVLAKVTPEAMGLWAKAMAVLPNSRLVMKDRLGTLAYPARRRYVQDIFAYHRVSADRLELLGKEPDFGAHLAGYRKVDVMLDPFPYNGTTTTCEALWMGVPVVALAGTRHAARVGVSVLQAAGLGEFVAATPEAYARTAVTLARDPQRLGELRGTLRERLSASPLLDAAAFAVSLEAAYRDMWQRWCRAPHDGAGTVDTLSLSDE